MLQTRACPYFLALAVERASAAFLPVHPYNIFATATAEPMTSIATKQLRRRLPRAETRGAAECEGNSSKNKAFLRVSQPRITIGNSFAGTHRHDSTRCKHTINKLCIRFAFSALGVLPP